MEANQKSHIMLENSEGPEKRETWNKKIDFLLSVIGVAVDLAITKTSPCNIQQFFTAV